MLDPATHATGPAPSLDMVTMSKMPSLPDDIAEAGWQPEKEARGGTRAMLANTTADRAIDVLLAFCEDIPTWSAAELAARFDMPRSTMYRYLTSLRACSLIISDEGNRYRLGPRVIQLARIAKMGSAAVQIALPHLQALSEQFGELTLLKERRGDELITIDRMEGTHRVGIASTSGNLLPWPTAPSAKAFFAFSTESDRARLLSLMTPVAFTSRTISTRDALIVDAALVRERGYACSDEELDDGVIGFAVPIFEDGVCRYTLSVAAPAYRWPKAKQAKLIDALLFAGGEIGKALSGS